LVLLRSGRCRPGGSAGRHHRLAVGEAVAVGLGSQDQAAELPAVPALVADLPDLEPNPAPCPGIDADQGGPVLVHAGTIGLQRVRR